jgi:hypothetical protein
MFHVTIKLYNYNQETLKNIKIWLQDLFWNENLADFDFFLLNGSTHLNNRIIGYNNKRSHQF